MPHVPARGTSFRRSGLCSMCTLRRRLACTAPYVQQAPSTHRHRGGGWLAQPAAQDISHSCRQGRLPHSLVQGVGFVKATAWGSPAQ